MQMRVDIKTDAKGFAALGFAYGNKGPVLLDDKYIGGSHRIKNKGPAAGSSNVQGKGVDAC